MYAREFEKSGQTRRFQISRDVTSGWRVRELDGGRVVWSAHYVDWHKVERARMAFALEAASLASAGWKES